MKLERKHWIWIGAGLTALTIGVIIHKKRKALKEKALEDAKALEERKNKANSIMSNQQEEVVHQKENDVKPINQVAHFPLMKGSSGYEVKVIQEYMNSTCKASLEVMKTYPLELNGVWDDNMEVSATNCSSIKRSEIDEDMYNRIYRDMKAANILPKE